MRSANYFKQRTTLLQNLYFHYLNAIDGAHFNKLYNLIAKEPEQRVIGLQSHFAITFRDASIFAQKSIAKHVIIITHTHKDTALWRQILQAATTSISTTTFMCMCSLCLHSLVPSYRLSDFLAAGSVRFYTLIQNECDALFELYIQSRATEAQH